MRIFVVKNEKTMTALRAALVREGAGREAVKVAEARLKAANPHVDFERLRPGDVLVVPDAAEFASPRAAGVMGPLLESSVAQAKDGLRQLQQRVETGEKEADRLRDIVARSLKTKAVKAAVERDELFRKDVERLREALSQDEKEAAARRKALENVFEHVAADLADLQQRFA